MPRLRGSGGDSQRRRQTAHHPPLTLECGPGWICSRMSDCCSAPNDSATAPAASCGECLNGLDRRSIRSVQRRPSVIESRRSRTERHCARAVRDERAVVDRRGRWTTRGVTAQHFRYRNTWDPSRRGTRRTDRSADCAWPAAGHLLPRIYLASARSACRGC